MTPGYFQALKVGLVRGRLLSGTDTHGAPPVAVINETAARTWLPARRASRVDPMVALRYD